MSTLQAPSCPKPSLTPRPVPAVPSFLMCMQLLQVALNLEPEWDWDGDFGGGTVPLKTAEIPGGTSTLQFAQDHQCLCRSCGGAAHRGGGSA